MADLTFVRGESTKVTDDQFKAALLAEGWKVEGEVVDAGLDDLKAEADALGLKYHHKVGAEKLAALIAEAKAAE